MGLTVHKAGWVIKRAVWPEKCLAILMDGRKKAVSGLKHQG